MELTNGEQIKLVRYCDNRDIKVTKTIEYLNLNTNTIKFKGLKKTFTIQSFRDGNFQFVNNNTIYCTEDITNRQTRFEQYGALKVIEISK
tara:strand:+ start:120 stop:389 length:270 start_codon:yes stop_codon:yes gene_type:complete